MQVEEISEARLDLGGPVGARDAGFGKLALESSDLSLHLVPVLRGKPLEVVLPGARQCEHRTSFLRCHGRRQSERARQGRNGGRRRRRGRDHVQVPDTCPPGQRLEERAPRFLLASPRHDQVEIIRDVGAADQAQKARLRFVERQHGDQVTRVVLHRPDFDSPGRCECAGPFPLPCEGDKWGAEMRGGVHITPGGRADRLQPVQGFDFHDARVTAPLKDQMRNPTPRVRRPRLRPSPRRPRSRSRRPARRRIPCPSSS